VIRPLADADIPSVVALINAADAQDGADEATSEAEFRDWIAQPVDTGNHFVALGPGGEITGYGDVHYQPGDEGAWGWVVVHPAWRRQGIGGALAACVREQARHLGVLWIDYAVDIRLQEATHWLAHLGYEPVRTYTRLRLQPEVAVDRPLYPPGFQVRTFRQGQDEATVCLILNLSFADHHNANLISAEQMCHNVNQPGFDPAGLFLAETAAGAVAGLCWCHINDAENARRGDQIGWINDLGVAPDYRRRHLGRALLLTGIEWLRQSGMQCVDLWVERGNREAQALYAAVGFQVDKTIVDYRHFLYGPRP